MNLIISLSIFHLLSTFRFTIVFIYSRLTGDNKITTENLLNKDNTHPVIQMNETCERILKEMQEEFEKTQTITEDHLKEERKEITEMRGILVFEKKKFLTKIYCVSHLYQLFVLGV